VIDRRLWVLGAAYFAIQYFIFTEMQRRFAAAETGGG
jgi:hypothetical protein